MADDVKSVDFRSDFAVRQRRCPACDGEGTRVQEPDTAYRSSPFRPAFDVAQHNPYPFGHCLNVNAGTEFLHSLPSLTLSPTFIAESDRCGRFGECFWDSLRF